MTTVTYKNGIIASDSKLSDRDGINVGQASKVFLMEMTEKLTWLEKSVLRKIPEKKKYLVGMCGALEDCIDYMDCIFHGQEQDRDFDASLLVIDEEGLIKKFEGGNTKGFKINSEYAAIGSGSHVALGALYHGASAEEAIKAAIFHDNGSGGAIQTLSFDDE